MEFIERVEPVFKTPARLRNLSWTHWPRRYCKSISDNGEVHVASYITANEKSQSPVFPSDGKSVFASENRVITYQITDFSAVPRHIERGIFKTISLADVIRHCGRQRIVPICDDDVPIIRSERFVCGDQFECYQFYRFLLQPSGQEGAKALCMGHGHECLRQF